MKIEPSRVDASIVLLGSFNPAIFNPDWFLRNQLIGELAYEAAETAMIIPEVAQFKIGEFGIDVNRQRMQILINDLPYIPLKDLALSLFGNLLPHSMVMHVGINHSVDFKVGSEEVRNAIGRILAPAEPWGEWGNAWKDNGPKARSGMLSISMIEIHPDDPTNWKTTITVQPSNYVPKSAGICAAVNDHFELSEQTGRAAAKLIDARFESSLERADWIIDQVMALKDRVHAKFFDSTQN